MLDFVNRRCLLELGVLEEKTIAETAVDIDVNILVNGGRDEEPAVSRILGRKVGASAAQRDPQRRTRDDHEPDGPGKITSRPRRLTRPGLWEFISSLSDSDFMFECRRIRVSFSQG